MRAVSRVDAEVASQSSISLLSAVYAAGPGFVGLRRRFPPARFVGIGLFAPDGRESVLRRISALLAGAYRIAGFLGVGAVLVLVSFLLQRAQRPRGFRTLST